MLHQPSAPEHAQLAPCRCASVLSPSDSLGSVQRRPLASDQIAVGVQSQLFRVLAWCTGTEMVSALQPLLAAILGEDFETELSRLMRQKVLVHSHASVALE